MQILQKENSSPLSGLFPQHFKLTRSQTHRSIPVMHSGTSDLGLSWKLSRFYSGHPMLSNPGTITTLSEHIPLDKVWKILGKMMKKMQF